MKRATTIALGLAGGYLLGRFRKARWLLMAAAVAAGGRATSGLAEKAEVGPELQSLAEQGRKVAVSVLGRQMTAATGRIRKVTESLKRRAEQDGGPSGEEEGGGPAEKEGGEPAAKREEAAKKDEGGPERERPKAAAGDGEHGAEEQGPGDGGKGPQAREKPPAEGREKPPGPQAGKEGADEQGGGEEGGPEAGAAGPRAAGPRAAGRRSGTRLSMQYRGPRRDPRADPTGRRRGTSQAWR